MTAVYPDPKQYPPPPPPAYQQPGAGPALGQNTVVVVYQPNPQGPQPGANFRFQEVPARITCQYCGAEVITTTEYTVGSLPWIIGFLICMFGLWLGCCLIPCCISALKDVVHTCPNCQQNVGRYNRMG